MKTAEHWIFTPAKGATILRTMLRTKVAADREAGLTTSLAELASRAGAGPLELAGNIIGPDLFAQLNAADIPDLKPDDDPAMSSAIAQDIANWIGQ